MILKTKSEFIYIERDGTTFKFKRPAPAKADKICGKMKVVGEEVVIDMDIAIGTFNGQLRGWDVAEDENGNEVKYSTANALMIEQKTKIDVGSELYTEIMGAGEEELEELGKSDSPTGSSVDD